MYERCLLTDQCFSTLNISYTQVLIGSLDLLDHIGLDLLERFFWSTENCVDLRHKDKSYSVQGKRGGGWLWDHCFTIPVKKQKYIYYNEPDV